MRRIIIAIGATLSGLVLLFSWPTSTNQSVAGSDTAAGTTTGGTTSDGTDSTTSDGTTSSSDGTTTTDGTTSDGTTTGTTETFTGDAVGTRYGDVQVQITVTDGALTAVDAIEYPSGDRHNDQINGYAIPILNEEALAAQSAGIDMVSGATVTSRGYIESLQSALDQAGL
jgi:uncharacterized protein with FMN-binding domain